MPRGTTFDQCITMFREEAGHAVSRRQGQNALPGVQAMLRRTYRRLHADFTWPHLRIEREVPLSAGQQYYAFPLDLDFDRVEDTWVRESGSNTWHRLPYGIGLGEYNTVASHAGARDDFPRRWELYEHEQFEVWPIPAENADAVRFYGISKPKALTSGNDTLDLDDDLVVLYAVAEQLARQKSADAEMKLQQAQQHYNRLRANTMQDVPISMAGRPRDRQPAFQGINIRHAERYD